MITRRPIEIDLTQPIELMTFGPEQFSYRLDKYCEAINKKEYFWSDNQDISDFGCMTAGF